MHILKKIMLSTSKCIALWAAYAWRCESIHKLVHVSSYRSGKSVRSLALTPEGMGGNVFVNKTGLVRSAPVDGRLWSNIVPFGIIDI